MIGETNQLMTSPSSCPAESIVIWLRHHVHMGTIISRGKPDQVQSGIL